MRRKHRLIPVVMGGPSDTVAPTVVITSTTTSPTAAATVPLTITFSEDVTGFLVGDITISAGWTLGALTAVSAKVYTVTATATVSGALTADIAAGVAVDGAGNGNLAATQYSITILPFFNAIGHWKLNETTGNRLDSIGARHLEPQNTVGYDAAGKIGGCATTATGAANYLLKIDATIVTLDWTTITITGWIYIPTTFSGRASLFSKGSGNYDFALWFENVSSLRFLANDSTSGFSLANKTDVTISVDTWYFICGRYNSSTKKAEVSLNNSAFALGDAITNGLKNVQERFTINNLGSSYGNGRYDSVTVWNRYLSDAEVAVMYNSANGLDYP